MEHDLSKLFDSALSLNLINWPYVSSSFSFSTF